MLVLVHLYCLDTVVGTYQTVALLEHNLHQLVVAVFVFCHEYALHELCRTLTHTDCSHVGGSGVLSIHSSYCTFEWQHEDKLRALSKY